MYNIHVHPYMYKCTNESTSGDFITLSKDNTSHFPVVYNLKINKLPDVTPGWISFWLFILLTAGISLSKLWWNWSIN